MDLTAIFIVGIVFGAPLATGAFLAWLYHRRSMQSMEIRAIEAKARLLEAQQRAPDWVDLRDPASMIAWQRARLEVEGDRAPGALSPERRRATEDR